MFHGLIIQVGLALEIIKILQANSKMLLHLQLFKHISTSIVISGLI